MNTFSADAFFAVLSSLGMARNCTSYVKNPSCPPIVSRDYGFAPDGHKKSRLRRGASKLSHRSLENECPTGFYWCPEKSCCVPRHLHRPLMCPEGFLWKECRCQQHCVLVYNDDASRDLGHDSGHETVSAPAKDNLISEKVQPVNGRPQVYCNY